jgi:hypothetical protein
LQVVALEFRCHVGTWTTLVLYRNCSSIILLRAPLFCLYLLVVYLGDIWTTPLIPWYPWVWNIFRGVLLLDWVV